MSSVSSSAAWTAPSLACVLPGGSPVALAPLRSNRLRKNWAPTVVRPLQPSVRLNVPAAAKSAVY